MSFFPSPFVLFTIKDTINVQMITSFVQMPTHDQQIRGGEHRGRVRSKVTGRGNGHICPLKFFLLRRHTQRRNVPYSAWSLSSQTWRQRQQYLACLSRESEQKISQKPDRPESKVFITKAVSLTANVQPTVQTAAGLDGDKGRGEKTREAEMEVGLYDTMMQ